MLRLFVGIEFPPELKLHLSLLETGIPGAKWVDPGNLHLTLRFIGAVDEGVAADIDEALCQLRARRFTLQLAGTGVFGGNRPRALWVGLEPEGRKYAPHVTVARLRDPELAGLGNFLAANARFRAAPLPVEHFSLIASYPTKAGSIYEDQADYPLSG